jgi:hypothetical protein
MGYGDGKDKNWTMRREQAIELIATSFSLVMKSLLFAKNP